MLSITDTPDGIAHIRRLDRLAAEAHATGSTLAVTVRGERDIAGKVIERRTGQFETYGGSRPLSFFGGITLLVGEGRRIEVDLLAVVDVRRAS